MDISIWGHIAYDIKSAGSIEAVIAQCKEAGISQYSAYVYPIAANRFGDGTETFSYKTSCFQSDYSDLLGPLLREGKKQGIKIQPWLLPFCTHLMKGETREELNRRGYQSLTEANSNLHESERGQGVDGLLPCPTWKENRDRAVLMAKDYIENHGSDLERIHLDYIRYRNSNYSLVNPCHCEACRKEYKKFAGKDFITTEEMSDPGILFKVLQVRHRYIHELVEEIRDITNKAGLMLTSAVRTNVFTDAMCEGQDWVSWLRDGLIDEVYCMNYVVDREWHLKLVRLNSSVAADIPNVKVVQGVGKESSCGRASTDEMVGAIQDVKDEGLNAISIFCYQGMEEADFEALKQFK